MTSPTRTPLSLHWRLWVATAVAVTLAATAAGAVLASAFRDHVERQFAFALTSQLDQLTARVAIDAQGQPVLSGEGMTDPRWSQPYSGLYWQIDATDGGRRRAVARSRSLWDAVLKAPADTAITGRVHVHRIDGPGGQRLLLVDRRVLLEDGAQAPWHLLVAADLSQTVDAVADFRGVLAISLLVLVTLLLLAALAQIAVGLAPLRALAAALAELQARRALALKGRFPAEVQPLVDGLNQVLEQQAQQLERARTQAGNLAHALRTPLTVIEQAAHQATREPEFAGVVQEQVRAARRHVDWHLARARAAGAQSATAAACELRPAVDSLVRVMQRAHAARALNIDGSAVPPELAFRGDGQDLLDLVGNLLDNACKWARSCVRIAARPVPGTPSLVVEVEDDGPGIPEEVRTRVLQRGQRLDESTPGSGLGLSIVADLARLHGGSLSLDASLLGGLRASLILPMAPGTR